MLVARAGMNAERQAVALGRCIDRPILAAAERHLAHAQHQHLHEALVGGAALDLGDGEFGVLHRHHDRGAQPRIAVEPFLGDPVVDRLGERRRHVLAVQKLHAIEAMADGDVDVPAVERVRAQRVERIGRRAALAAPIRPRGERRVRRIADQLQRIHAAVDHAVAPIFVEMRQQRLHARHIDVHVAIDRRP